MASQYFDYEHIDPTADVENHRRVLWACAVHTVVHTVVVHDMGSGCGYTDLMQINCLPLISSIAIWSHSLLVRGGVMRVGEICRGRKELREIFLLVVTVHLLLCRDDIYQISNRLLSNARLQNKALVTITFFEIF